MLCRRAIMPACERLLSVLPNERPPLNKSPLFIRIGDKLDFGIIWADWASANFGKIKSSTWAAAGAPAASPAVPAISGELIDQGNQTTTFVLDASGEEVSVGDEYFIENTVVFEASASAPVPVIDRIVRRRLHIKVTAA